MAHSDAPPKVHSLPNLKDLPRVPRGQRSYSDELILEKIWGELIKLRMRGIPVSRCAKLLGYHVTTVRGWMNQPAWKILYLKTRAQVFGDTMDLEEEKAQQKLINVEKLIDDYSVAAIEKIKEKMLSATKEEVQLKAAIDLADRGPRTSKTKKVQASHLHALLTPQQLAQASAVAKEIRLIGKPIVPVEIDPSFIGELDDLE